MPNIPHPDKATLEALAKAGYPDPGPPAAGLIAEAFPAVAAAAGVGLPIAGGVAAFEAARGIADAAQTQSSIGQYLIGSGGAQQSSNAPMNAVVSALNRLAGLKSRL
jgi:hypothetical protein